MDILLLLLWPLLVLKAKALIQFSRFFRSIRTGRFIAAQAVRFERLRSKGHPRILIAGDSTAVGTGSKSPALTMAGYFGADFSVARIVNVGKNGLRIPGLAARIGLAAQERFDVCIILIGGNDAIHRTSEAEMRLGLETALAKAASISDIVVLMTQGNIGNAPIFPGLLYPFITRRADIVRRLCREAAEASGVGFVDVFVNRRDDHWLRDPEQYYAADRFHPSAVGYREWYERVRDYLDRQPAAQTAGLVRPPKI